MSDFSKLSDAEINRLVAERLGWTDIGSTRGKCPFRNDAGGISYYYDIVPDYCNEANAYMQLVEKMAKSPYTVSMESFIDDCWKFSVTHVVTLDGCDVVAESRGRAIAECFLKWHDARGKSNG